MSKVNIIEVTKISGVLKILPIVLEIEKETVLLAIKYCVPGLLGSFIYDFISLIKELPTPHRKLIVGDINLDQILPEHVSKVDRLIRNCNLTQRSQYSTHVHGKYWIRYLILPIPILFLFCCHAAVTILFFFSKSEALYLYRIKL